MRSNLEIQSSLCEFANSNNVKLMCGDLKTHSLVEYKELVIDLVNYGFEHGITLGISEDFDGGHIIVGFYHYDKLMKLSFDKDVFLREENIYNFQHMVESLVDQFAAAIDIPEKNVESTLVFNQSIQMLEGNNDE